MRLNLESALGGPTIGKAFPSLFTRSSPVVERDSSLFMVASLLRFHWAEAALILVDRTRPVRVGGKVAFVAGHRVLKSLFDAPPRDRYSDMFKPSEANAVLMPPLESTRTLRDLLQVFHLERYGFTAVTSGSMFCMVGLSGVLGLFEDGTLDTGICAEDVATQPVSVPKDATLGEALGLMLRERIRRVFIGETKAYISDREVIGYLFSPRKLQEVKRAPAKMFEDRVVEVGPVDPEDVDPHLPLRECAKLMARSQGGTLCCPRGVISPWDIVMKPFASGDLLVS